MLTVQCHLIGQLDNKAGKWLLVIPEMVILAFPKLVTVLLVILEWVYLRQITCAGDIRPHKNDGLF